MRPLLILVLFVGCSPAGSQFDWGPVVAVSAGAACCEQSPAPAPKPTPTGKCENCNGTGKVGDGTVFVKCVVCDGKGTLGAPAEKLKGDELDQAVERFNRWFEKQKELAKSSDCTCPDCKCDPCECKPAPTSLAPAPPAVTLPAPAALPQKRYILGNGRVVLGPAYDDPGYRAWYDAVVVPAKAQSSPCGPGGCPQYAPRGFFGRWR